MKLTTRQICGVYSGINVLNDDESIKLESDAYVKIAINMNLLQPFVRGYDRARIRCAAELNAANRGLKKDDRRSDAELQADLIDKEETLLDAEQDVDVRTFLKAELRMPDNPKINGGLLHKLWPICADIEIKAS